MMKKICFFKFYLYTFFIFIVINNFFIFGLEYFENGFKKSLENQSFNLILFGSICYNHAKNNVFVCLYVVFRMSFLYVKHEYFKKIIFSFLLFDLLFLLSFPFEIHKLFLSLAYIYSYFGYSYFDNIQIYILPMFFSIFYFLNIRKYQIKKKKSYTHY